MVCGVATFSTSVTLNSLGFELCSGLKLKYEGVVFEPAPPATWIACQQTSSALITDAVHMFARSLHALNQTEPHVAEAQLSCDGVDKWEHGERIVSYIKAVRILTGHLRGFLSGGFPLSKNAEATGKRTWVKYIRYRK